MKVACKNGHKWYTEYGHDVCPRCSEPPVAEQSAEAKALAAHKPPKGHVAQTIDLGSGITVFACSRGK